MTSKTKAPDRPMTRRLLALINQIVEESEGTITKASIAKEIGTTPQEIYEWMAGSRSLPNGEKSLLLLAWAEKKQKNFAQKMLSQAA